MHRLAHYVLSSCDFCAEADGANRAERFAGAFDDRRDAQISRRRNNRTLTYAARLFGPIAATAANLSAKYLVTANPFGGRIREVWVALNLINSALGAIFRHGAST